VTVNATLQSFDKNTPEVKRVKIQITLDFNCENNHPYAIQIMVESGEFANLMV